MDYDSSIQDIIAILKEDKSVVQPWRNKATSRLEEVQAFIRMGETITYEEPDEPICTCPEGGKRRDCPVHGENL